MAKDFTVTITNPERAAEWQRVLGTTTLHVTSPIPFTADLPDHPNACIFLLDLDLITPHQRARLVAHLAAKFDLPQKSVAATLDAHGVPILAKHCTVTVAHPHKWFCE